MRTAIKTNTEQKRREENTQKNTWHINPNVCGAFTSSLPLAHRLQTARQKAH